MTTTHVHKLMVIGGPSWSALIDALPQLTWNKGALRGFVLHTCDSKRVIGGYAWRKKIELETHDEETLQPTVTHKRVVAKTAFALDFQKGLIWADSVAGMNALHEAMDEIPNVNVEFEQLNLNLAEMLEELQGAYKKQIVTGLKINDYLDSKQDLTASPMFKLLDPANEWKVIDKFKGQLGAIRSTIKLPDGASSLTIRRTGAVSYGEHIPEELMMFVRDILPRFHESEVETAEVVDTEK